MPQNNAELLHYNLRNNENVRLPFIRSEVYRRSFFPYAIRLWNKLQLQIRNATSIRVLKSSLKKDLPERNILYYYGKRWASVHHSRLRMRCSKLNFDLCCKLYVRDSPACRCGASRETASHFLLDCPLYEDIRINMITAVNRHTACNTETLLYGNANLSSDVNQSIFDAVHKFICESNRFI